MPRAPVLKSAKKVTKPKKTTPSTPTKTDRKVVAKKSYTHPTYEEMIARAIMSEAKRGGSSRVAIARYLQSNFDVPEDSLKRQLRLAISRLASKTDPRLIQVKGSFRVSKELRHKIHLLDKSKSPKKTTEVTSPKKSVLKDKPAKVTPRKSLETASKTAATKTTKSSITKTTPKALVKTVSKTARTAETTPKATKKTPTKTTSSPMKRVVKSHS
eukprot:TRINITY_DN137_c0_g4_i1.p1 TRINITY_DN137_c0_g4~~TRINITY_DN137_c0_g4_i1.p1  ORF type:complete len:214 (+),score=46.90 TRINITY_DN137_c0_g4_i1:68-709(+)